MTRHAIRAGAFLLLCFTTPLAGQRSDRRVIDAAGIASAGWHRLGDVASALPPGSTATVDGFNHELSGSRIGFFEAGGARAMWMVRLDGQHVPVHLGGLWILDAIPVSITQLDSIVISDGPRIVDGRVTYLGTIDLFTRRPRKGGSIIGDYQHGDETGDPGPYRYTPRGTQNVEKLGPFASGAAAVAGARVSVDLGARYSSLNVTDKRITDRIPNFGFLQSDVNASGGSGVATLDALGGTHFVLGGRGRFTGLMRVPTLAADQSSRVITSHAGASGSMTPMGAVRYAASVTRLDVEPYRDAIPLIIEQARLITDVFLEASPAEGIRVGVGTNYGEQATDASTRARRTDRLWVGYAAGAHSAVVAAERSLSRARVSGSARREQVLADSGILAISVSVLSSSAAAENAWMEGIGTEAAHGRSTTAADVRVDLTTKELLGVRPTWYARGFGRSGMQGAGSEYVIAGGLVATSAPFLRTRIWGRAEISQLMGDPDPGDSSMPSGFAEASVSTRAPGRFLLAASARYSPATRWAGLEDAALAEVPATRALSASVNKSLWSERVRAQLVMRNLLNTADRTHPLGAQWNLRTHLAVTIALP